MVGRTMLLKAGLFEHGSRGAVMRRVVASGDARNLARALLAEIHMTTGRRKGVELAPESLLCVYFPGTYVRPAPCCWGDILPHLRRPPQFKFTQSSKTRDRRY